MYCGKVTSQSKRVESFYRNWT